MIVSVHSYDFGTSVDVAVGCIQGSIVQYHNLLHGSCFICFDHSFIFDSSVLKLFLRVIYIVATIAISKRSSVHCNHNCYFVTKEIIKDHKKGRIVSAISTSRAPYL